MSSEGSPGPRASRVDVDTQPRWLRTGYRFFPYAAYHSGQWWVLRMNHDFPQHDLYTIFIDGRAATDLNGDTNDERRIVASIGALHQHGADGGEPELGAGLAEAVVRRAADYIVYGSEVGDPCDWCAYLATADPMERR